MSFFFPYFGDFFFPKTAFSTPTKWRQYLQGMPPNSGSGWRTEVIVTLEQLETYVSDMSSRVHSLNERTRSKAARMKELKNRIRLTEDFSRLKPIVDAIPPKGSWGKKHEKYLAEHDSEIRQFHAVRRKLNSLPVKALTPQAWQTELDKLSREYAAETEELKPIYAELKKLRTIQYHASAFLHDQQDAQTHTNLKEELF